MNADTKTHWDTVYRTKEPDAVSWYRRHLERSLALIKRAAPDLSASIIDMVCHHLFPRTHIER